MANKSVNDFYTWFLFNIDTLLQDEVFMLYIAATYFKNLSPGIQYFLYHKEFRFPQGHKLKITNRETRGVFGNECSSGGRYKTRTTRAAI